MAVVFELLATITGLFDALALGLSHRRVREEISFHCGCCRRRENIVKVKYLFESDTIDPFGEGCTTVNPGVATMDTGFDAL